MIRIDLHTHSNASPDGGLRERHYRQALASGRLDYVAVTDHTTVAFAQSLQAQLGPRVIVGQEIMSLQGEVIGLYLQSTIPAGQSLAATVQAIRQQNGLVYVPHPFETVRHGISATDLQAVSADIDIVEIYNGRALTQGAGRQARAWAAEHAVAGAASSDAHGPAGWPRAVSLLAGEPDRASLVELLHDARYTCAFGGWLAAAAPKYNRLRKRWTDRGGRQYG